MNAAGFAEALSGTRPPYPFRRHQTGALEEIDRLMIRGDRRRAWVVLPPGTGKTLVGLETIRRLGRPAVVLGPNTAIQSQWVRQWQQFTPPTIPIGIDRSLATPITALTYQSLATFDPDDEVDEEGTEHLAGLGQRTKGRGTLLDRLHPNGLALVERIRAAESITLVLDECHHLLDIWGRLLADLLDLIPQAYVLGLTATPPDSLSRAQVELVDDLFGHPVYGTSIPAVVRDGHLAPFAELAWLTVPTAAEAGWVAAEAERFEELATDLADPEFGSIPFLSWLDLRFVNRRLARKTGLPEISEHPAAEWHRLAADEPELAAAALRMHYSGLLALPPGARLREEHRHDPTAEDWVTLLKDWLVGHLLKSEEPADQQVRERIRRALPSIGYVLTKRGIRKGPSPVDRVLARSAAKTHGAVEIVAAELANLGGRLRTLILCDHERASATLPATLRDVLTTEAGSARLMLENLVADPRTAGLGPMLVTGKTVASNPETAEAFRDHTGLPLELGPPEDGVVELIGSWTSRTWVPLVTSFFESGGCQVLVGTRGLLGEGWDARGVSGLIDLTTATTPTAVVQTRGRALRTDPGWPDKTAVSWTVVCVTEDHPKGGTDWDRFVRKHRGYFGIDESGEIVDGVAHVDHTFSPFSPPAVSSFDEVNARMLIRAERRDVVREQWRVGTPYADTPMRTVRIRQAAAMPTDAVPAPAGTGPRPPRAVVGPDGITIREMHEVVEQPGLGKASRLPIIVAPLTGLPVAVSALGIGLPVVAGAFVVLSVLLGVGLRSRSRMVNALTWLAAWQEWRTAGANWADRVEEAARPIEPTGIAYAIADAMHEAGQSPIGSGGVWVHLTDGEYRIAMSGVDPRIAERFAEALDEALSSLQEQRYAVPRYTIPPIPPAPEERLRTGLAAMAGWSAPDTVVWHAVPSMFCASKRALTAYVDAWNTWVCVAEAVDIRSPEGAGILATHQGVDPFDVTTALRLTWE